MRRFLIPLIFGLGGFAILASLGIWQLQRHQWKQSVLAEIEAKIGGIPMPLPINPKEAEHEYMPVSAIGGYNGKSIAVLTSVERVGPAYRNVSAFLTEDRWIMVDRGWVSAEDLKPGLPGSDHVAGNLHWPDEVDGWTPEPDLENGIFYARDVATMAEALGTEPILIVAREPTGLPPATPMPVGTEGIPNNHWGYAIQWFGLALVWLGMTAFLLWRIHRRTV